MTVNSCLAPAGQDTLLDRVVNWGRLDIADFARLPLATLRALADPTDPDWAAAAVNAPELWPGIDPRKVPTADHTLTLAEIQAAQRRLVRRCWRELLIAKAPALYEALPWQELELAPLLRGRQLWRLRLLLAGGHSPVSAVRLRRTAGVIVVEPEPVLADYIERKAGRERLKKLRVVRAGLERTGLPARAVEVALVSPSAVAGKLEPAVVELERVAAEVFIFASDPLIQLDTGPLEARGYRSLPVVTRWGAASVWHRPGTNQQRK